ncbi:MAG: ERCC4 domain-containing protein [Candidatus Bathyarchaeia archaeon]
MDRFRVEFMSGSETLVPYLREKKDELDLTIIVDSREANSAPRIIKGLKERGINVKIEVLEKGDYILSDVCAVERKTVHDFVYTLTHRYLFEQLFKLKEAYPKALILLEGYMPIIYRFSRIKPTAVWGALFNLAKNGIAIVNTTSYKETVDFLHVAARQEQIMEKRVPTIHPVKRCENTFDAQIFFVASLPNIGREKAIAILKSYQTPLKALINVDDWPKTVYGIGQKISSRVKEVLNTPFRE